MDLQLYAHVLWRFRLLVGVGLVMALALALFSIVRVELRDGSPVVTYREPPLWASHSTVMVTQPGFPIGRSIFTEVPPAIQAAEPGTVPNPTAQPEPRFADPDRFTELTVVYARLARSDPVQRLLFRDGVVPGAVAVEIAPVAENLPLLDISGIATSPRAAILLARRQTEALKTYIASEQRANGVPAAERVELTVINRAGQQPLLAHQVNTLLLQGVPKMRAAVVFVAVMGLVIGLVFVLENLRPRVRVVADPVVESVRSRSRSA